MEDHQVAIVDIDEGVLEESDMSGIHLIGFLVKKGGGHFANLRRFFSSFGERLHFAFNFELGQ